MKIAESPFLDKHEAVNMLGSGDFGDTALTSSLGVRADIGDGWEEFYYAMVNICIHTAWDSKT